MNWLLKKIWLPLYGRWVLYYMQKPRSYRYAGLQVRIPPGVFHPGLFFSTPAFIDFLQNTDFQKLIGAKSVLKLDYTVKRNVIKTTTTLD